MLDNGKCFSKEGEYYKDFLKPRTNNDLRDYLRLGLVPKVPGIYGKEKLEDVCLEDFEDNTRSQNKDYCSLKCRRLAKRLRYKKWFYDKRKITRTN